MRVMCWRVRGAHVSVRLLGIVIGVGVPEAPASFSDFTFELEGQDVKMDDTMFGFEGGTDTVGIDELFPDHEMFFEGEEAKNDLYKF